MSTQITTQKILAFDEYADFGGLPGIEGYIYIDKAEAEAYLWDSTATPPAYVRIGEDTPIPPDPAPLTFVDAATTGILSFLPNYYNGPSNDGVGATLTATQVGVLRDNSGVGKIDSSYVPVVGGLILVKNQALQYQNGIYVITNVGSPNPGGTFYQLTRVADFNQASELFPLQVNVLQGTVNANQYFNQATPSPLVIGTSNLVFSPANYATAAGPIAFVDVATTTALPACVYANGTTNPSYPGLNATLTASAFGTVLTVDGLTASTSATPLGTFTRVLVKDQANKAHNGDYVVVNGGVAGSPTVKWQLRRINYGASGFYRFTRYFLVSNTQASLAGKIYITKQQNPALSNLGIGTQLIDLVEYGGSGGGLPAWVETNATDLTLWCNGKGNIATNTVYGDEALKSNTTGTNNVAFGNLALSLNTTGTGNTALGTNALKSNTTGANNTAIGRLSLQANTTASGNTAIGMQALQNNTTGYACTAIGTSALINNTTGFGSTAIGSGALASNTTGNTNTAIGLETLYSNTTGYDNTGIGLNALRANITGIENTAIGRSALATIITGARNTAIGYGALALSTSNENTAIGHSALTNNSTGTSNVAIGYLSLLVNTTGSSNTAIGNSSLQGNTASNNTAVGERSLRNNTTGASNTAIGGLSLFSNTTGSNNTVLGGQALQNNTTGTFNVAIGHQALNGHTTGNSNTAIGYQVFSGNFSGSVIIGRGATATADNQFAIGSSATNAGSVTSEINTSSNVWNVIINGVARKILLA